MLIIQSTMKGVAEISIVMLVLVSVAATPGTALSCNDVAGSLASCMPYLTAGGNPTDMCCTGVRSLAGSLQSQNDRQTACYCIKSAMSTYNIQSAAAANLAGECGVNVGVPVTANVDCSQIS